MADHASPTRPASIEERVIAALARVLYVDEESLDPDVPLTESGLDSILAVEFMGEVKEEFGLSLMVATLYEHDTPRKFGRFVAAYETDGPDARTGPDALAGPDAGDRDAGEVARRVGP
jgi:acyl carrier protein